MISYEKAKLFLEQNKDVHISCDGRFFNGKILEANKEKGFLIIVDFKLGETPILFEDILNIEPYVREGK